MYILPAPLPVKVHSKDIYIYNYIYSEDMYVAYFHMSHVSPALDSNYTPHLRRRDNLGFLANQGLCQASDETKRMPVHSGIYF